jgi:hypothetical protein
VWIGGGVAAAGAVVGAVTGLMAMSKAQSVQSACSGLECPRSIDSDLSSGRTLADVSTVAFAVGGAGLVTMVVGLVVGGGKTEPAAAGTAGATIAPCLGIGAGGVRGTF